MRIVNLLLDDKVCTQFECYSLIEGKILANHYLFCKGFATNLWTKLKTKEYFRDTPNGRYVLKIH